MSASEDKARARQLRAEARRRRRDEALRRYQERTERRHERDALEGSRRAAEERIKRELEEARALLEAERLAAEAAEREAAAAEAARLAEEAEAAEREAAAEAARLAEGEAGTGTAPGSGEVTSAGEDTVMVEPDPQPESTVVLADDDSDAPVGPGASEVPTAGTEVDADGAGLASVDASPADATDESRATSAPSMTAGLPSAPREFAGSASADTTVPAPPSPRRSLLARVVRFLGSCAVAVGSLASVVLALGALTLALGERPTGLFEAIEPVCRALALGTGAELSPLDTLVTWIVAAVAYLIIGFALQAFSRQITGRRRRV